MTVNEVSIDIDLDIGSAIAKIESLRAQMKTLSKDVQFDLDSDNFDINTEDIDPNLGDAEDIQTEVDVDRDELDDLQEVLKAENKKIRTPFEFKDVERVGDPYDINTKSVKKSISDPLEDVDNNVPITTALDNSGISSDELDLNDRELGVKVNAKLGDRNVETSLRNAIDQKIYNADNVDTDPINREIKSKLKHPSSADRTEDIFPEFRGFMDAGGSEESVFGGFDPVRRERDRADVPRTEDLFPDIFEREKRKQKLLDMDGGVFSEIGEKMKTLIPSFRTWRKLIAFLLPQIIVLAGAALGLASAFGAIGVAGASILGLGLIGHGDDMAESFKNAGKQVDRLKKNLFTAFQAPAQKFAPIQERLFNMIPGEMASLSEEMEGLTSFEGVVELGIKGAINLVEELITLFNEHSAQISRIGAIFGGILSDNVVGFFDYFINEIENSQSVLIAVGSSIKKILKIIYNFSKAFSGVLLVLQPVLDVLLMVSRLLNNKFVMSIITGIAVVFGLTYAITSLSTALIALNGSILATTIGALVGAISTLGMYTVAMWEAVGATTALATTLSYLTLGGVALLGGAAAVGTYNKLSNVRGGGAGGGYDSGTTVINNREVTIKGDASQQSVEKLRDENNRTREEISTQKQRERK